MLSSASRLCLVLALTLIGPCAFAALPQSGAIELDPSRTAIAFKLPGSLHTTHGTFELKRGAIKIDLISGAAGGLIVVDVTSGESGLSAREDRMRDSILETQKFPEILFAPYHVTGHLERDGRFRAVLQGMITLRGEEHQLAIDAVGTLDGDLVVATARFSIPYVRWGLKDPSVLFLTVAKQVDIDITAVGQIMPVPLSAERLPND